MEGLEGTEIVEFVGAGAQRQIRFRGKHPLSGALRELFNAEAQRVDELLNALRDMFREIPLLPIAAWIEGITPLDTDDGNTLVLWVLADPKVLDVITERASDKRCRRTCSPWPSERRLVAVTREELEHAIRAACDVAGDTEVYVFGSQGILGIGCQASCVSGSSNG